MRLTALAPALLAAALVAGCGSDAEPAATAPAPPASTPPEAAAPAADSASVTIEDFRFVPKTVTVKTGAKVAFENLDQAPHTATIAEGAMKFDTGTVEKGKTKSVTFDKPGTYAYVCLFHAYMKGTVTVKG